MTIIDFTYDSYKQLIANLKSKGYHIANYHNHTKELNPCIIRHDVDYSLEKAAFFAEFENKLNVKSTYFVLLNTDFYNVYSKKSREALFRIIDSNHEIGLHFDEKAYSISSQEQLAEKIRDEINIFSEITKQEIKAISMHRPSKELLSSDLTMPGIINSYSKKFIESFKYFSDSRMFWREDVEGAIDSRQFDKLHILTHPFWYSKEKENTSFKLRKFIIDASKERYNNMNDNFRELDEFIDNKEIFELQ